MIRKFFLLNIADETILFNALRYCVDSEYINTFEYFVHCLGKKDEHIHLFFDCKNGVSYNIVVAILDVICLTVVEQERCVYQEWQAFGCADESAVYVCLKK